MTEEQKDIFEEIKNLLYVFTFKAKNTEELESLEDVMNAAKKTAEGLRDMRNIAFPEPISEEKIELVLKSIDVNLNQKNNSIPDKNNSESNDKNKKEISENKKTNDEITVSKITDKIRKTSLISKPKMDKILYAEPSNPRPKVKFTVCFILDDISFDLWGKCRSCKEQGEKCKGCGLKGGVRVKIIGFTLAERQIKFTAWDSQFCNLFGLDKRNLTVLVSQSKDFVRKEFLKLYRARLFVSQSTYTEFNSQLSISVNKLDCINWNDLLIQEI